MGESNLITRIAQKNFNINGLVEEVIYDESTRSDVLKLLWTNSNIMVYYHCFYIITIASEEKPELFYKYWNDFVLLLDHKNSYHRDIGLTIIGNLTKVDEDNWFSGIFEKYIKHLNDDRFMTAQCFVRNLKKILKNKNEYMQQIIELLLDMDNICTYPKKQIELLKSDVIEVLDEAYESIIEKNRIEEFVRFQSCSLSPKTKKKAKEFLKKYNL